MESDDETRRLLREIRDAQREQLALRTRLESAFVPVQHPREDVTARAAPKTGSWTQWEMMCKRR